MAPTLVTTPYSVNAAARDLSTLTTPSFTPSNGEVIVVKAASEGTTVPTIGTPTGGSQTYTLRNDSRTASHCEVALYTAIISGSPGSMTVAVPYTANVGYHSIVVERWSSAQLAATPATNTTEVGTTTPSTTLTTVAANSVVSWVCGDWNATAGTRTYRSSATEDGQHDQSPSFYRSYFAYQTAAAAGSQTMGLTAPTGQIWALVGIEIQDAAAAAVSDSPISRRRLLPALLDM